MGERGKHKAFELIDNELEKRVKENGVDINV